jgi:hypothetical protein
LKIESLQIRLPEVKIPVLFFLFLPLLSPGQGISESEFLARLQTGGDIKEEVLSKRSAVLYSYTLTPKEINTIHENLIRSGIDASCYFETDLVLAGRDAERAYSAYFVKREIATLILIQKSTSGYSVFIGAFTNSENLIDHPVWSTSGTALNDVLTAVYRAALANHKKKNFLINDVAETDLPVPVITGRRAELFAYDLKVDNLAVVKFGDEAADGELEEIFKSYPLRHKLVDKTIPESDLRKQGFLYVLCVVHARGKAAKKVLDYSLGKSESAFVSVTYPNGQVQLKNISADTPVYKFYVRHIDSGNVFLGTKWDADTTWQQALQNFIKGLKAELRLN